jgi:hypothetical protein
VATRQPPGPAAAPPDSLLGAVAGVATSLAPLSPLETLSLDAGASLDALALDWPVSEEVVPDEVSSPPLAPAELVSLSPVEVDVEDASDSDDEEDALDVEPMFVALARVLNAATALPSSDWEP